MTTDACGGCAIARSRRAFLRDGIWQVSAVLASLRLAQVAAALPVGTITASSARGSTRAYPIPPRDGAQIDRAEQVILVRWQNEVVALGLACPHQNTALRWVEADRGFHCPKHHSRYDPVGTFLSGRATRSMDRYAVEQDGTNVAVDLNTLYQQDTNPAEWRAAVVRLT